MIMVAVVGLALAGVVAIRKRREGLLTLADFHYQRSPDSYIHPFWAPPPSPHQLWHQDMGRNYRYAAARPWLPVSLDPPAPPLALDQAAAEFEPCGVYDSPKVT
jgi:hypothetical protein